MIVRNKLFLPMVTLVVSTILSFFFDVKFAHGQNSSENLSAASSDQAGDILFQLFTERPGAIRISSPTSITEYGLFSLDGDKCVFTELSVQQKANLPDRLEVWLRSDRREPVILLYDLRARSLSGGFSVSNRNALKCAPAPATTATNLSPNLIENLNSRSEAIAEREKSRSEFERIARSRPDWPDEFASCVERATVHSVGEDREACIARECAKNHNGGYVPGCSILYCSNAGVKTRYLPFTERVFRRCNHALKTTID